jgi:hypothetical protein
LADPEVSWRPGWKASDEVQEEDGDDSGVGIVAKTRWCSTAAW